MQLPLFLHLLWQMFKSVTTSTPKPLYRGIDVSEWNGTVDFQALRSKIDFAILRCGYGSDYPDQDDAAFQQNVRACNEARIPYGVYLYTYAANETMAQSEADHVFRLIKGTDPAFGVWYDVEDRSLPGGDKLVSICKAWRNALLDRGITCVGVYASLSLMENDLKDLTEGEKWVAQWNSSCDYPNPDMWQFTDRGVLNGKKFDINYAYKDYPDITGATMTQEKFNEMLNASMAALETKPVDSWAKETWEKATKMGLFDGTAPRSPLTREQAAVVLDRFKELF